MKRHLPWALAASFVVVACAANEDLEFLGEPTENPNSSILGDAAPDPNADSSTGVVIGWDMSLALSGGMRRELSGAVPAYQRQ